MNESLDGRGSEKTETDREVERKTDGGGENKEEAGRETDRVKGREKRKRVLVPLAWNPA